MDQSTQVNFPIVMRNMKRHNTFNDLDLQVRGGGGGGASATTNTNNWFNHNSHMIKPIIPPILGGRPKSLNIPSSSSTIYNDFHQIVGGTISRERTPPFSSNSSIISTSYKKLTSSASTSQDQLNSTNNNNNGGLSPQHNYCCCCNNYRQFQANTAQGLSWRHLHMSRAKLKATATTSELLSGFAMVAMVELQINESTDVPEWLFVMFTVCTTILVAVHIFALMISTYILPHIDAVAKLEIRDMVAESPHERMRGFIELAWAFSTVLGLFLFLVEVAILCWVKFWDYSTTAAIAATIIVIPVLIIFVLFAAHFYHSLVVYKCDKSISDMEKLEVMKKQLDQVVVVSTSPV